MLEDLALADTNFAVMHSHWRCPPTRTTHVIAPFTFLLVAAISTVGTGSIAAAESAPPPLHPTLLVAELAGTRSTVIAVEGNQPVIVREGKRVKLAETTPLFTERAAHFGPARATLAIAISNRERVVYGTLATERHHGERFDVTATITAATDLPDSYFVIIAFDRDFLTDTKQADFSQISLFEAGSIKAGETRTVRMKAGMKFPHRKLDPHKVGKQLFETRAFGLLMSQGAEVAGTAPAVAREFFFTRERAAHRTVVATWRAQNREGNRPAMPFLQIPPLLDSTDGFPNPASATLTVDAEGIVIRAMLDQQFPPLAAQTLEHTLGAWLFMPALKDGMPVTTRVRVPLRF